MLYSHIQTLIKNQPQHPPGYCCEMASWSNAYNTNTQTYTFHAQLPRKLHTPQEVHVNLSPMGRTVGNGWGLQHGYLTTPHFMLLSRYTSSSASQGLWWAVLSRYLLVWPLSTDMREKSTWSGVRECNFWGRGRSRCKAWQSASARARGWGLWCLIQQPIMTQMKSRASFK